MVLDRLFAITSVMFPQRVIDDVGRLLQEADFDIPPRKYVGLSLWVSYSLALIAFAITLTFAEFLEGLFVGIVSFAVSETLFFLLLTLIADNRAKKIEEALPDALQMISANMRAGMTIENAVLASARPEFGPLEEEIRRVSTKVYGGMSMAQAFKEMAERVRSKALKRAIRLIIEGSTLGGQMAQLLHEIARDIREMANLRHELQNATIMYTIFIVFSTVLASPILFSTSIYYTEINELVTRSAEFAGPSTLPAGAAGTGFLPTFSIIREEDRITAAEMTTFAITCIIVTTFFSALTLGLIRHGRVSYGVKYILPFMVTALLLFFVAHYTLTEVFKSFIALR